jgi:parallel beta-helix repeat protein
MMFCVKRQPLRQSSSFAASTLLIAAGAIAFALPAQRALAQGVIQAADFGVKGDGVTDDTAKLQAAADAANGGELTLLPQGRYLLRGQVVLKTRVLDCQGGELLTDPASQKLYAMVRVSQSHVVIRNCGFNSGLGQEHFALILDPKITDITVEQNRFKAGPGHGLVAVGIRAKGISQVRVVNNRAENLRYLVYVDGNELHTWHNCANLTDGTRCDDSAHPPSVTITEAKIPSEILRDTDQRHLPFAVLAFYKGAGNISYRLWEGEDFVRSGDRLVLKKPIASDPRLAFYIVTWDPAAVPADDLRDLSVRQNIGNGFRAAAVQINCPVRAANKRTPFEDCPRRIIVNDNQFGMPLEADTFSSFVVEGTKGVVAQVISMNGVNEFEVKNNTITAAADQGIHTEDYATNGIIADNVVENTNGWGIYLTNSKNVAIVRNRVTNSALGCIALDAIEKTSGLYTEPYMTNQSIKLIDNRCNLNNNPRAWAGFLISGTHEPLALEARGNIVTNLNSQRAKAAYLFRGTARCDRTIGSASGMSSNVPVYANCGDR